MIPLMTSPGRPNTVSTPHSARRWTRSSDAIVAMSAPLDLCVSREDVGLGTMPHGMVAGGFDIEAVVVGDGAADAAADDGQHRACNAEREHDAGGCTFVPEAEDPHRDPDEDEHGDRHHG